MRCRGAAVAARSIPTVAPTASANPQAMRTAARPGIAAASKRVTATPVVVHWSSPVTVTSSIHQPRPSLVIGGEDRNRNPTWTIPEYPVSGTLISSNVSFCPVKRSPFV